MSLKSAKGVCKTLRLCAFVFRICVPVDGVDHHSGAGRTKGWAALIDGHSQAVERTDFALSGIAVPAGTHRVKVTFSYAIEYDYDGAWWWTRYLPPGIPAVILGFLLTIRYISDLFISSTDNVARRATSKFVAPLLLLPVFFTSASRVHFYNIYDAGAGQEEMKKAAQWAGKIIPEKSLVVSEDYSGVVPYYINRPSLRYDQVTPEKWSVVKDRIKEKGYQLYALLIYNEPDAAKRKIPGKWTLIDTFNGHSTLWRIDQE